jgi:type IV secretory pathway protease TraF
MTLRNALFTGSLLAVLAVGGAAWFWVGDSEATVQVVGDSMAPGLRQGDQVQWNRESGSLQRYQRVICQLAGSPPIIKRVMGFGGESLSCQSGELFVDGIWQQKNLWQLASLGVPVIKRASGVVGQSTGWCFQAGQWAWSPSEIGRRDWLEVDLKVLAHGEEGTATPIFYDDSPWLTVESRRLQPVRDVGLATVVTVNARRQQPVEICLRVGRQAARVIVRGGSQVAIVAGRLDGRMVAAAWPVGGAWRSTARHEDWLSGVARSAVPPGGPREWAVVESVPADASVIPLAISAWTPEKQQVPTSNDGTQLMVDRLVVWRDLHWLPHPSGQSRWEIPAGHLFLLGDCPAVSRDSRHWGTLAEEDVLGVVTASVEVCQTP